MVIFLQDGRPEPFWKRAVFLFGTFVQYAAHNQHTAPQSCERIPADLNAGVSVFSFFFTTVPACCQTPEQVACTPLNKHCGPSLLFDILFGCDKRAAVGL